MAAGLNVFVSIGAKIGSGFNSSVRQVERRFDTLARHVKLRSAEMKAAMRGLEGHYSRFATNVSMPAGMAVGLGARFAYEWSKVGNELQAVTQMSDKARKDIEAVARGLPGNPAQNLSAALDLARTGFNAEQIRGTLPTTIKLSRADSSVDAAAASDIMTNVIKGMGLPEDTYADVVQSAERAANNIAFAAAQSSTDVRLMGESFKYAAPLAKLTNIEMEVLSGAFMTMADAGIKGSEAGVAFRSGLVRLLKPTKGAYAVLDRFNMKLEDYVKTSKKMTGGAVVTALQAQGIDAKGSARAIDKLLAQDISGGELIQKITDAVVAGMGDGADAMDRDKIAEGVTSAMLSGVAKVDLEKFIKDATDKGWGATEFVNFFDTRQGTRLATLFGPDMAKNIERVRAALRGMDGSGSFLDKMYALQMQGAVGPWERMKQSLGNLVIAMAESGVMDTIANAMDSIAKGVMALSQSNPGLLKFFALLTMGAAAAAPLGWALSGIAATGRLLVGILGPLARGAGFLLGRFLPLRTVMVLARYGFMAALAVSWPLAAALAAIGLAAAFIVAKWDGIVAYFTAFKKAVTDSISPESMESFRQLGDVLSWLGGAISIVTTPLGVMGEAAKIAWGYLKEIFAPANTEAWAAWGTTVGKWVGWVADKLGSLMTVARGVRDGIAGLFTSTPSGGGKGINPRGAPVPGRALGGSVSAGMLYQWNERGREAFVPGRSGTVIPAHVVAALNRGGGRSGGGVQVGQIVIQGANDPQATAVAVRKELSRLASGQSALLSD